MHRTPTCRVITFCIRYRAPKLGMMVMLELQIAKPRSGRISTKVSCSLLSRHTLTFPAWTGLSAQTAPALATGAAKKVPQTRCAAPQYAEGGSEVAESASRSLIWLEPCHTWPDRGMIPNILGNAKLANLFRCAVHEAQISLSIHHNC
jgi:hypothetical protein